MPARSGGAYILDPVTGELTRRVETDEPMPAGDLAAADPAIPLFIGVDLGVEHNPTIHDPAISPAESEAAPASDPAGGDAPADVPASRPRRRAAKTTGD